MFKVEDEDAKQPLLRESPEPSSGRYQLETKQKFTWYLAFVIFTAVHGSFLFGWNIGGNRPWKLGTLSETFMLPHHDE
jgi:hypothetical protein